MSNVNFITSNPAIDAFQQQERHLQNQKANDLRLRREQMELAEQEALRGYRMEEAGLRMEGLRRDNTEANATSLDRVQQTSQQTQLGGQRVEAGARENELKPFWDSIELIKGGQYEAAKQIAKRMADPAMHGTVDTIIDNERNRTAFVRLVETARNDYANNPAAQQEFITKGLEQILSENATIDRNDPAAPQRVQDAPARPEYTYGGRGGGGAGWRSGPGSMGGVAGWKYQMALENGATPEEAMQIANGEKSVKPAEVMKMVETTLGTEFGTDRDSIRRRDPKAFAERKDALLKQYGDFFRVDMGGLMSTPQAPAAPAAPAAAPPGAVGPVNLPAQGGDAEITRLGIGGGNGSSRETPHEVSTQEQIDWLKANRKGSWIKLPSGQIGRIQ